MKDIQEYISCQLNIVEEKLKLNNNYKSDILLQKNKLLDILFLIELYEKYEINRKNIDEIIVLPNTSTNISEYRIIDDNDLDDKQYWQEVEIGKKKIRLHSKDIIIKKR